MSCKYKVKIDELVCIKKEGYFFYYASRTYCDRHQRNMLYNKKEKDGHYFSRDLHLAIQRLWHKL